MADMTLYLGNRNYSSWSLRAWLALKASGLPFDEEVIPLYEAGSRTTLMRYSPSGHVPVLHHKDLLLWESLAIGEYVAELAPDKHLLPVRRKKRAAARDDRRNGGRLPGAAQSPAGSEYPLQLSDRGVTPEVSGYQPRHLDLARSPPRGRAMPASRSYSGAYTLADATYARSSAGSACPAEIELDEVVEYADAVWALPALQEWVTAAGHEPMIVEEFEF